VTVAPANAETARAWDGPTGAHWAAHVDHFDAQVADYLPALLEAAAVAADSDVLDVGCGAGRTTRELARRAPRGTATGIDLSTPLLELARERAAAEGLANVRFVHGDAQAVDLGADRYDRVVSRNGVQFFADPGAAFTALARALRPGGRLALSVWQPTARNEWFTAFRTAAAGFTDPEFADVRAPMRYGDPATAEAVVTGVVSRLLDELDDDARAAAVQALRETLRAHLGPDGVVFRSAMWIITAGRA
jgi:SAM-dependent methyltransferase